MAAVSSSTSLNAMLASANDPSKQLAQPKPADDSSNPDKVAAKKAYEQPSPTTNAQGQALGQVINETA